MSDYLKSRGWKECKDAPGVWRDPIFPAIMGVVTAYCNERERHAAGTPYVYGPIKSSKWVVERPKRRRNLPTTAQQGVATDQNSAANLFANC